MKTRLCSLCSGLAFSLFLMIGTGMLFSSCKDELLEDSYPEWLGSSIYGELENRGNFRNTLRLIEDLNYAEVLRKTGSKTVFAADDAAWQRFFAGNSWGVTSYDGLSLAQKKWIFNNSMINAPYLEERLSSAPKSSPSADPNKGMWMRRANSTAITDTIQVFKGSDRDKLPSSVNNPYWGQLRQQEEIYIAYPIEDRPPMVHFASDFRENKQITDEDMRFIFGDDYDEGVDARRIDGKRAVYLWGDPVVEKDITCQNGYIHVLRDLLVPPSNMAEELEKVTSSEPAQSCSIFNAFLNRYTMPMADESAMRNLMYNGKPVFRKAYFAQSGAYSLTTDSAGQTRAQILFDPSWQTSHYATNESFQQNMSAMFVPSDQALTEWWNSPTGQLVMNGLGSWDEVPNDLLARLINNHMKTSFLGALPSVFGKVLNDGNREQGIKKEDIVKDPVTGKRLIYPANNGIIYVVNKVYTPDSYISVMAPCLNVTELAVMGYAVLNTDKTTYIPDGYGTYLNSMESKFTFVVPTNEAMSNYVNPFYVGEGGSYQRANFSLTSNNRVQAVWTKMDSDGTPGESTTSEFYMDGNSPRGDTKIQTILKDILDNCIVVMKQGQEWDQGGYYQTKGGAYIHISDFDKGAVIQSGGNIERGETPQVTTFYNQSDRELNTPSLGSVPGSGGNGVTMAVNQMIQPTLSTVHEIVKADPELSEFTELLVGSDSVLGEKFATRQDSLKLYQALISPRESNAITSAVISRGEKVGFLGNYNYTLYAPNNAAMQRAYEEGLPRWEELEALPVPDENDPYWTEEMIRENENLRKSIAKKILSFIRFHFQDNSIFTDGNAGYYKTQAFNDQESVFYELAAQPSMQGDFTVTSRAESESSARVLLHATTVNKMAREYLFDRGVSTPSAIGGASKINSSSSIVVHTIDAPLFFSPKGSDGMREQFK